MVRVSRPAAQGCCGRGGCGREATLTLTLTLTPTPTLTLTLRLHRAAARRRRRHARRARAALAPRRLTARRRGLGAPRIQQPRRTAQHS